MLQPYWSKIVLVSGTYGDPLTEACYFPLLELCPLPWVPSRLWSSEFPPSSGLSSSKKPHLTRQVRVLSLPNTHSLVYFSLAGLKLGRAGPSLPSPGPDPPAQELQVLRALRLPRPAGSSPGAQFPLRRTGGGACPLRMGLKAGAQSWGGDTEQNLEEDTKPGWPGGSSVRARGGACGAIPLIPRMGGARFTDAAGQ